VAHVAFAVAVAALAVAVPLLLCSVSPVFPILAAPWLPSAIMIQVCSSDFIGHQSAGIVDAPRTAYSNQRVNLYVAKPSMKSDIRRQRWSRRP
jgi:hypothetical protein